MATRSAVVRPSGCLAAGAGPKTGAISPTPMAASRRFTQPCDSVMDGDSGPCVATPRNGVPMLPNFKIVICGVILFAILIAVTGAGVVTPQTYTRIGEMPEVGRPLMQRVIADEPGLAQFQRLTVTRRSEELARLRELPAPTIVAEAPVAPGNDEPLEPAMIESPDGAPILATIEAAPASSAPAALLPGDPEPISGPAANADAAPRRDGEIALPDEPGDRVPRSIAASPVQPIGDAGRPTPAAKRQMVRPAAKTTAHAPKHRFHRARQPGQTPSPNPTFGLFGPSSYRSQ
jgi:hypothetical protein